MTEYGEFHDGTLEGLRVDSGRKKAHINLSTTQRERTTIVLKDVVRLKADGFREGNIVFSVCSRTFEEITFADITDLYDLDASRQPATWELELAARIKKERLQILEITPSYGGTCTALAGSIEFLTGEPL